MNLKQACKILEISETSSLAETKQAYKDLVQIWHPDRYSHSERLQRKAQERMKELNAAYEFLLVYRESQADKSDREPEQETRTADKHIIICWNCGVKNRVNTTSDQTGAKCGKCGSYLNQDKQKQNFYDPRDYKEMTLCGDGECVGIIDSTTRRCTICGKTYEEGVEAEKTKARSRMQRKPYKPNKIEKLFIYISIGIVLLIFYLLASKSPLVTDKPKPAPPREHQQEMLPQSQPRTEQQDSEYMRKTRDLIREYRQEMLPQLKTLLEEQKKLAGQGDTEAQKKAEYYEERIKDIEGH